MSKIKFTVIGLAYLTLAFVAFASRANPSASDEIARLAALMQWRLGGIVADIGAGDGRYAFAAVRHVGPSGKVFATEIDASKLAELRAEVKKRNLQNVLIL